MAKCKNCNNLYNLTDITGENIGNWCSKKCDNPDPEVDRKCDKYEGMTNGDKIRNMSDKELAEHILSTPFNNETAARAFMDVLANLLNAEKIDWKADYVPLRLSTKIDWTVEE